MLRWRLGGRRDEDERKMRREMGWGRGDAVD